MFHPQVLLKELCRRGFCTDLICSNCHKYLFKKTCVLNSKMDNYFYKEEHITTRILQNSKEIRVKLQKVGSW